MQNFTEIDVGRCSMDFGVLENIYLDAEIVLLYPTNAQ